MGTDVSWSDPESQSVSRNGWCMHLILSDFLIFFLVYRTPGEIESLGQ